MAERVWNRFLTEQDKATLIGRAERNIGFGERPALLLIDLYRWVFGDKPEPVVEAIKNWPGSCGLAGWNALPNIQKLLGKAREVGIPIIAIRRDELT
jgi:nicotinamidase-related amidase